MKKILLLSAAYLNGGAYVDAGTEVPVGTEKLEMTEERAAGMINGKLAEDLPDDEDADGDAGDGTDGAAPTAARNKLLADIVAALMADETLGGTVELVEDDDLRMFTAEMSSKRRLGFAQDFAVQFTTSRADPAQAA